VTVEIASGGRRIPDSDELTRALEGAGIHATSTIQQLPDPPPPLAPKAPDMTPLGALDLRA
jgi:hypothetical protein